MKNSWWKIATVIILLYVIIAGLLIPLKPGITGVSKSQLKPGTNVVTAYVYNGHLTPDMPIKPILFDTEIFDEKDLLHGITGSDLKILSDQVVQFKVHIPDSFSTTSVSLMLYVNNFEAKGIKDDYAMILVNAFTLVGVNKSKGAVRDYITGPGQKDVRRGISFPNREILNETIRNLLFHVPMWFAMMLLMFIATITGIMYLRKGEERYDMISEQCTRVGLFFGILGVITGSIWARYTWGNWWAFDVKLNGAALTVLIYLAYLILRNSINDEMQRARVAAVYSVFAFVLMIVFVMIVPRIYDSLHPGNGGNPGMKTYDLDSTLRMVFYPAVLGWIGLSLWILQVKLRIEKLAHKLQEV